MKQALDIKIEPLQLQIKWEDGTSLNCLASRLRNSCQCANCVNEFTGEPLYNPKKTSENLTVVKAEPIGHYALAFTFSDGHATGIYTFESLARML